MNLSTMLNLRLPNRKDPEYAAFLARDDLRAEADRDLARRSVTGVFSYFLVWVIIYFASGLEQASNALLEFLGFILAAASVGRLYLALNFHQLYAIHPRTWRRLFAAGTIISAAIWGGVSVLALSYDGLGTTSVMVLLSTAGIAAGGIVSLAPAAWLGGVFVVLLLFPIVPFALFSGQIAEKGVALLFLTFFVFMFMMWRRLYNEYWHALAGRGELVLAKEAAEAANLAKGQFIANVSHELRTPLTAIIGALGMIESYPPGGMPAQTMTLIDMAYQNGKRLSVLINDILDFEKLNANRMEFHIQPVALTPFLTRAIELNHSYAENYSVSFTLEPSPEFTFLADEHRLMQVMTNLLSNAAKHSPKGEQVVISVRAGEGRVRVAVSDRGAGVPESFRANIFEKFAQAKSSSTDKANGTGLGLAISKAIIDRMGGTIGFDSVVGQGATFYFELPQAEGSTHGNHQTLTVH
ncbi:MAG TPA: HAMP domain-containing sensor histidine kinase [Gallionella sp.]